MRKRALLALACLVFLATKSYATSTLEGEYQVSNIKKFEKAGYFRIVFNPLKPKNAKFFLETVHLPRGVAKGAHLDLSADIADSARVDKQDGLPAEGVFFKSGHYYLPAKGSQQLKPNGMSLLQMHAPQNDGLIL